MRLPSGRGTKADMEEKADDGGGEASGQERHLWARDFAVSERVAGAQGYAEGWCGVRPVDFVARETLGERFFLFPLCI